MKPCPVCGRQPKMNSLLSCAAFGYAPFFEANYTCEAGDHRLTRKGVDGNLNKAYEQAGANWDAFVDSINHKELLEEGVCKALLEEALELLKRLGIRIEDNVQVCNCCDEEIAYLEVIDGKYVWLEVNGHLQGHYRCGLLDFERRAKKAIGVDED